MDDSVRNALLNIARSQTLRPEELGSLVWIMEQENEATISQFIKGNRLGKQRAYRILSALEEKGYIQGCELRLASQQDLRNLVFLKKS
jgi:hypothetical protein